MGRWACCYELALSSVFLISTIIFTHVEAMSPMILGLGVRIAGSGGMGRLMPELKGALIKDLLG